MNRLYNVTINYLGLKKKDNFEKSRISLMKDGFFLVLDSDGNAIRFTAHHCKVDQITAGGIIISGFTDKPRHITAFCMYETNKTSKGN